MNIDASQLLKLLGSATPRVSGASPATVDKSLSTAAFDDLLAKARSGELNSSRLVEVDPDAGVDLSSEQIAVLSAAADRAEAQGLRQALVIFDDVQVTLDVGSRRVTGKLPLDSGNGEPAIIDGVDGVINLSSRLRPQQTEKPLALPTASFDNPAVASLLERLGVRQP